jgi:hypothetical protein
VDVDDRDVDGDHVELGVRGQFRDDAIPDELRQPFEVVAAAEAVIATVIGASRVVTSPSSRTRPTMTPPTLSPTPRIRVRTEPSVMRRCTSGSGCLSGMSRPACASSEMFWRTACIQERSCSECVAASDLSSAQVWVRSRRRASRASWQPGEASMSGSRGSRPLSR